MVAAAAHRAGARPWVWWHTAPRWQRWPVAFVIWFCIIGVFSVAMTDMAYAQCTSGNNGPGCGLTTGGYTSAGENLLPAYRWSDSASGIYTNFGASDTTSRVLAGIAGLFLAVASIIWRVTLFLLETAISVDVVQNSAEAVNDGYVAIFDAVTTSGITIFVTIFAVMVIGVRVAMGSEQNPGRSLFRLAVAVGLVFMFAQSAATQNNTSPGAVMVALDDATSVVTEGLLRSFNGIAPPPGTNARDQLDCANYTAALYDTYDTNVVRSGTGPRGGLASGSNYREASQAQMSLLWEEAYLTPWTAVQFGDAGMGRVMRCRFLETDTAVPDIQADVHQRGGATMPTGDGDEDERSVFNQNRNGEEFRRNMAAWATCARSGGGFDIRSPWETVNGGPDNGGPTVEECEEWYNEGNTEPGDNPGPWHIEERSDIGQATDGSFADCEEDSGGSGGSGGSIGEPADDDSDSCGGDESQPAPRARTFYNHLNGHVGGAGVGASLLAMVVAGVFAWALIGLSLGLIIAQFGIILAFICLPIWLLVRAWPGEGAAEISKKMSRVGVGMLFSKVVFVIALGVLIVFMSALRGVADASGLTAMQNPAGGLTGADAITSSLVIGLIPLASVLLLRKAGDAIGLKGLGTMKGTASLVANAANPNGGGTAGAVGAKADQLGRRARAAVGREVRMRRHINRQQKLKDKSDDEREKRKGRQGQVGGADADTKPGADSDSGKDAEKGKDSEKGKGALGGPRAAGGSTGSPTALPGAEGAAGEVEGPGRGRRALATVAGAAAAFKSVPLIGAAAYALGAASLGSLAPAAIGVVGGLAVYKGVKRRLAPKEVPVAVEGAATHSRDLFVGDTESEVPDAVVEPEAPYTWERATGGGWVPTDPRPADGPAPVVEPARAVDPGPSGPPVTGRRPG